MAVEPIHEIVSRLRDISGKMSEFEIQSLAYQKQTIQILAEGLDVEVPEVHQANYRNGLENVSYEIADLKKGFESVVEQLKILQRSIQSQ